MQFGPSGKFSCSSFPDKPARDGGTLRSLHYQAWGKYMNFFAKSGSAAKQRTACAIVGVYTKGHLTPAAAELDKAGKGLIGSLFKGGDFSGEAGSTLLLTNLVKMPCSRILLVGLGDQGKQDKRSLVKALQAAMAALARTGAADAISYLTYGAESLVDPRYAGRLTADAWHKASYRFLAHKTGARPPAAKLKRLGIAMDNRSAANAALRGAEEGVAITQGMALTQDLANTAANVCTPSYLGREAQKLAKAHKSLTVEVMGPSEIHKLKMGAFESVARGTEEPARLIVIKHKGAPASQAPVVLVGKGITFDSGGISLKPPPAMDEMKFDMNGAASVIGTMRAVALLELPINVVAVIPSCENMPSGRATKPGDIVTSMSGKTIEILNTDAEGRLILCDALTYARRFKPSEIIDVATLTGACVIALGPFLTGLMANDDSLAQELLSAGKRTGDEAWHLPIGKDYEETLKSNFADFSNMGTREGGALIAASFLSKFTEGQRWAHLDIAGTAWKSGQQKGSTGRPVHLLVDFLMSKAGI
jgi:leucyl aminopeptidase